MLDKLCRFVQFSIILAPFAIAEISLDYYYGDSLRANLVQVCSSEELIKTCHIKCGPDHACVLGKCFCLHKSKDPTDEDGQEEIERSTEEENTFGDFQDYTEITPLTGLLRPQVPIAGYEPKPELRHHIAHFCPNLDVARQCIRKCRKLGKPAFCGKDHNCYCGHKYDYPLASEKAVDPADAYAEFKDMYEKYFGPKDRPADRRSIDMTALIGQGQSQLRNRLKKNHSLIRKKFDEIMGWSCF